MRTAVAGVPPPVTDPAQGRGGEPLEVEHDGTGVDVGRLRGLGLRSLAVRFAFGAAVAVAAAIVATLAGERAGGVLLAFPAVLPAALTLIESREGTSQAVSDVRGAVAGALGLVAFALTVLGLTGRMPGVLAVCLALVAWAVAAVGVYAGGMRLSGVLGEQQYLPDVPVSEVEPAALALREAGLTVAVAESCTGGCLAALLTSVPGASDFMRGALVVYTDDAKRDMADVPASTLERTGTVSTETAVALAEGARRRLGADVGVGVTGLTGGPAEGKPPGLIYVAAVGPHGRHVTEITDAPGPEAGRTSAVRAAVRACCAVARMSGRRGGPR